jgi:hypothetical protein
MNSDFSINTIITIAKSVLGFSYQYNKAKIDNLIPSIKQQVNNLFYTIFVFIFLPMWALFLIIMLILGFSNFISWWTFIIAIVGAGIFLFIITLILQSSIKTDLISIENDVKDTILPYFSQDFENYLQNLFK